MAQEDVHLDDAGLALGLSLGGGGGGGGGASTAARHGTSSSRLSTEAPRPLEPSLTLSMPDEATATGGSGGSGGAARSVSSRSVEGVKRERVDDAEGERASSTAAAARAGAGAAAEDDDDGSTRKKLRLTKEQSKLLEDRFKDHSTLNPKQKIALAKQLKLRPRQVEVWFQNRRARTKLKQTEVDCELLKRCCESLSEENRRLQRELQELRALKLAGPHPQAPSSSPAAAAQGVPVPVPPPLYVQMQMQLPMPAATLSLCPSCERLRGGPKAEPDRPQAATHRFFNPFTHSAAC